MVRLTLDIQEETLSRLRSSRPDWSLLVPRWALMGDEEMVMRAIISYIKDREDDIRLRRLALKKRASD